MVRTAATVPPVAAAEAPAVVEALDALPAAGADTFLNGHPGAAEIQSLTIHEILIAGLV